MSSKVIIAGSALLAILGSEIYAAHASAPKATLVTQTEAVLKTQRNKVSYGVGVTMASPAPQD